MNEYYLGIKNALLKGNAEAARKFTELALMDKAQPEDIICSVLVPVMNKIGKEFKLGNLYIPDVLMSSRAMHGSLYVLRPILSEKQLNKKGKILIGTVAGDLHDIGKNMVSMQLESDGYEVIDYGIDVTPSRFIDGILKHNPDVLALSALLTTTMGEMKKVIEEIEICGLRNQIKIIIGGGPIYQDFADEIGADAYGEDIFDSTTKVNKLLNKKEGYFSEVKHEK